MKKIILSAFLGTIAMGVHANAILTLGYLTGNCYFGGDCITTTITGDQNLDCDSPSAIEAMHIEALSAQPIEELLTIQACAATKKIDANIARQLLLGQEVTH